MASKVKDSRLIGDRQPSSWQMLRTVKVKDKNLKGRRQAPHGLRAGTLHIAGSNL